MKEILALHQKILALPAEDRPEEDIDLSRDETGEGVESLPDELREELESLRKAINAALPEDFNYFVFLGQPDEEPFFGVERELLPVSIAPAGGKLDPERSLLAQLGEVDWEATRAKAKEHRKTMDSILYMTRQMTKPLRPAKSAQREFREEMRDFVREKRADAGRIHVMYWDQQKGLREADLADGEALREALPGFVAQDAEIVAIVAWGKPLPVERIDALKAQAQKAMREDVKARMQAADEEAAQEDQAKETDNP